MATSILPDCPFSPSDLVAIKNWPCVLPTSMALVVQHQDERSALLANLLPAVRWQFPRRWKMWPWTGNSSGSASLLSNTTIEEVSHGRFLATAVSTDRSPAQGDRAIPPRTG